MIQRFSCISDVELESLFYSFLQSFEPSSDLDCFFISDIIENVISKRIQRISSWQELIYSRFGRSHVIKELDKMRYLVDSSHSHPDNIVFGYIGLMYQDYTYLIFDFDLEGT